jgi:predicted ATP-dependent endonuclease of OLD family
VLPSRRRFNPLLSGSAQSTKEDRAQYISNTSFPGTRGEEMDRFQVRIFEWQRNIKRFNSDLKKILDTLPNWSIEQYPSGQYYLKFDYNGFVHSSDGLGDGIINIFFIVDALYDSGIQHTIVIDEPELSLHPSLQKRVLKLLAEYAKDRQIVIATHSPYFINFDYLANGARLFRTVKENNLIKIYQLSTESITSIKNYQNDLNNPHVLGLNAKEVFFLEDRVILVEGQDDKYCYEKMQNKLGILLKGEFFGWGVGGTEKMKHIAKILHDLGYKKVVGILDSNDETKKIYDDLSKQFKDYKFFIIPTEDVRKKSGSKKTTICDKFGELKNEHIDTMKKMFEEINRILET